MYIRQYIHVLFLFLYINKRNIRGLCASTYNNLNRISFKPQCIERFERLTRSPRSNNRSFLLHKANRSHFRLCKHRPGVPQEIDLTQFVRIHPDLIKEDVPDEIDLTQFVRAHPDLIEEDVPVEIDLTQIANSYFDLD